MSSLQSNAYDFLTHKGDYFIKFSKQRVYSFNNLIIYLHINNMELT
jgi:hypothetical protein